MIAALLLPGGRRVILHYPTESIYFLINGSLSGCSPCHPFRMALPDSAGEVMASLEPQSTDAALP